MSRRHRVQYSDAIYHVTSRGVNRGDIFVDDRDRQAFLDRLGGIVAKLGWLVYAFALMSNHFHLFFRTPQPDLCRGMQLLLGQYARRFNRAHRRTGALFEGRFRCQVIEDESDLWTVSRYVHLNPVPHLVRHPAAWPWSSYQGYCDPRRRVPWVRYDDLLAAWRGAFGGAADGYLRFVESQLAARPPSPFQDAADGWILGSDSFVARVRRLISPQSNDPSAQRARWLAPVSLSQLVEATCDVCDVVTEKLSVKHSRSIIRPIVAFLAQQHSGTTLTTLARTLGLSRRDSVPALIRKARQAQPGTLLHTRIQQVRQRLGL